MSVTIQTSLRGSAEVQARMSQAMLNPIMVHWNRLNQFINSDSFPPGTAEQGTLRGTQRSRIERQREKKIVYLLDYTHSTFASSSTIFGGLWNSIFLAPLSLDEHTHSLSHTHTYTQLSLALSLTHTHSLTLFVSEGLIKRFQLKNGTDAGTNFFLQKFPKFFFL